MEEGIVELNRTQPKAPLFLSPTDPTYLVPAPIERIYEEIQDDKNDLYVADWDEDNYIVIGREEDFRDKNRHYLPRKVGPLQPYDDWLKGETKLASSPTSQTWAVSLEETMISKEFYDSKNLLISK